jgi:hypothetical protein
VTEKGPEYLDDENGNLIKLLQKNQDDFLEYDYD